MRKFLSLVLALVMTMSLVVVGTSAKTFTDESDINYDEAVDVVSAIGIMDGYEGGNFDPAGVLTRGAAAKIICNMVLGPTTASALNADTAPFPDVPANHVFAGYIAYCQQQKIIDGYSDGTFRPAATLSGYAFMKMLLTSLGYDTQIEGFTGGNWTINVAKLVSNLGLADGNDEFSGNAAVTREQASQYAFNALQADIVEYDNKNTVTINGQAVNFGGTGKAKAMTWQNSATAKTNIKDDGYVQFAEQYFNKLVRDEKATNAFAEPSTKWTWKGAKIGTYTDTPDVTYSTNVKLGQIYEDLGMSEKDKEAKVFINGVEGENVAVSKNNSLKIANDNENKGLVGDGSRVHVYYNDDTNSVTICVIDVYVGVVNSIVTKVADPYIVLQNYSAICDADDKDVAYNDFNTDKHNQYETDTDKFEEDDIVLFTYSQKDEAIKDVWTPESVTGEVTKIVATKSLDVDSTTTYKYSRNIGFLENDKSSEKDIKTASDYNLYLDEFGYVIYVEEEEFNPDEMAFVLYTEGSSSTFGKDRVQMVTASGKVLTVDTDDDYSANGDNDMTAKIVYYRKNSDGAYALREIETFENGTKADPAGIRQDGAVDAQPGDNSNTKGVAAGMLTEEDDDSWTSGEATGVAFGGAANFLMKDNNAKIQVGNGKDDVRANSETVFIVAETNENGKTTYTAYKGIKNAPSIASNNKDIGLSLVNASGASVADVTGAIVDAFWTIRSNKLVGFMFIDATNAAITSGKSSIIFLAGQESVSKKITNYDNKEYYTYNAVVDGEITTVNVLATAKVGTNEFAGEKFNGVFTRMEVDGKGFVKGFDPINSQDYEVIIDQATEDSGFDANFVTANTQNSGTNSGAGVWKLSGKYTVGLGGVKSGDSVRYTVDEAAMIYFIDKSGNITKLDSTSQITSDSTSHYIAMLDQDTGDIKYLFIQEHNNDKKESGDDDKTDEAISIKVSGGQLKWSWNNADTAKNYSVTIDEIVGGIKTNLDTVTFTPASGKTLNGQIAASPAKGTIYRVTIKDTTSTPKTVATGTYEYD